MSNVPILVVIRAPKFLTEFAYTDKNGDHWFRVWGPGLDTVICGQDNAWTLRDQNEEAFRNHPNSY